MKNKFRKIRTGVYEYRGVIIHKNLEYGFWEMSTDESLERVVGYMESTRGACKRYIDECKGKYK